MEEPLFFQQKQYLANKLRGKSVFISGATGLIGFGIVRYLLELNDVYDAQIQVIALYRDAQKKDEIYGDTQSRTDLTFVYFDAQAGLDTDIKSDYIIHCAGISGGSKMHLKAPVTIFDVGIRGTQALLDYAIQHDCEKFVYVSTYEIYGSIDEKELINEEHACNLNPLILRNCYAEIKRLCEALCRAYSAQYGMNICSGRLTSTFGTGVSYEDPRFFAEFARCIIEGRDIVLKSSGNTVRNYLDVDDAASAFLYILADGENGEAYNITNMSNAISIRDIATMMLELTGNKVKLKFDIDADAESMGFRKESYTVMDATKLEALGWKPVYSMSETLMHLLDSMNNIK